MQNEINEQDKAAQERQAKLRIKQKLQLAKILCEKQIDVCDFLVLKINRNISAIDLQSLYAHYNEYCQTQSNVKDIFDVVNPLFTGEKPVFEFVRKEGKSISGTEFVSIDNDISFLKGGYMTLETFCNTVNERLIKEATKSDCRQNIADELAKFDLNNVDNMTAEEIDALERKTIEFELSCEKYLTPALSLNIPRIIDFFFTFATHTLI